MFGGVVTSIVEAFLILGSDVRGLATFLKNTFSPPYSIYAKIGQKQRFSRKSGFSWISYKKIIKIRIIMVDVKDVLESRIIVEGIDDLKTDRVTADLQEKLRNLESCYFHPVRRSCPENGNPCDGKIYSFGDKFMQERISVYRQSKRNFS